MLPFAESTSVGTNAFSAERGDQNLFSSQAAKTKLYLAGFISSLAVVNEQCIIFA